MKVDWKPVFLFILLAAGLSFPIQQGYLNSVFMAVAENTVFSKSGYLLAGSSTLIAALVAIRFHRQLSNRITIAGDDSVKNLLIAGLPVIAFSITGLSNGLGMNRYLYGFSFAAVNLVYAFTEEFGWRRYLQNALEGLNKNLKYLLIGVVWWVWHFRFNTQFDIFIFPLICVAGGFLLGKLTDEYRSILPAVMLHTLIILTTGSGAFGEPEIIGILLVTTGWIIIEQIWKKKNALHRNYDDNS